MTTSRRTVLVGLGGLAAGAATAASAAGMVDQHIEDNGHLPYYGGYASAVRPDLRRPGAASTTVVWRADRSDRRIALTFDDGPAANWTGMVLDALDAADVRATFFVVGDKVRRDGRILRDAVGRHEIGNHSWDHTDFARLDHAAVTSQLTRTTEAIHAAYGVTPTLFRPPYGHVGGSAILAAAEAGLATVLWSAQFREGRFVDHPSAIVDDVAGSVHPGAIVLGHDTGSADRRVSIDHLPQVIGRLQDDGWSFATVSELLTGA